MAKKPSFFDRLTGASFDTDFDTFDDEKTPPPAPRQATNEPAEPHHAVVAEEEPGAAQLTVDVYQTPTDIVIRALVAGVKPEDLDVAITRDMVTIKGKRVEQKEGDDDGYVYQELYWGAFERTIVLPAEVDVDGAEASEKHGLLTIRLPKLNKDRQTKLRVKGN
ncbi:MAG: Hsp20/alpha crystallin family protein [Patescibacteria group bacterium]|nr:Hsp20/alpha crystallin family protein [Patescibacteria group bacterium]